MNPEMAARLQHVEMEYARLEELINASAQGQDIAHYGGQSVLYVDAATQQITDATAPALELLGYAKAEIVHHVISDLEIPSENSTIAPRTYVESSIEEQVYQGFYRHRLGHPVKVQVRRRLLPNGKIFYYHLEDQSLHQRLWHELQRRKDDGFKFQQKLKTLNEITIKLSRIDTYDALCYQAIKLGIEALGFDRVGMWFLDAERKLMTGSYGVDEQGVVRPEHDQRWSYNDTYIDNFVAGKTDASIAYDDSPIYNEKSEIIHYGWHISAPILHGDQFIGILTSDNYLRKQPMKSYEPELLRQYGITVGHLIELVRVRDQSFTMRLAQEHTQILKQFITNVGHDFKTPLSIINTRSFLMLHTQTAEQRQSLAHGVQEQVMVISTMLDRMLEFIALASNLALTLAPTDLLTLLLEVVTPFRSRSDQEQIQFEIVLENSVMVPVDAEHLKNALSEILDNAFHYTTAGGKVRLTLAYYPKEIGIRIHDSGIGIDNALLDKIFNPLYRVDQARTERRVGLGLAIAKMIVEAHQGRIVVTSTSKVGSTFEIILPL